MASIEPETDTDTPSGPTKFGTFGGVFTPSILTILGVVMYLLVGRVTGLAGLGGALLIVFVSHLISVATGLSISSIATNRTVGAGGAYFMISRALGAPTGAAVGIPLFFAQALSVTFYIIGFTESVLQLLPEDMRGYEVAVGISTGVNVLITGLSLKSADLAIKAQYFVMAAIAMSLIAFFTGTATEFPMDVTWFAFEEQSFSQIFAVFFPAVTGIMAGVSMSGDLEDPRRSIPRGTMAAIGVGFLVYAAFPIWLALNAGPEALRNDPEVVWKISAVPALIYAGVWGATLSSALGSILTAPRTLQALAMEGLMPRFLGRGSGPSNEPRVGTVFTFALAQLGIVLGELDVIAPVLTMFFLATYGVINIACGLEKWAASPSFRPTFRVPAGVSLGGGLMCFYVMSIIDMRAMVAAAIICGGIFALSSRRSLGTTYGDARHGIWSALVRSSLHRLRRSTFHPQNWRPNLILLGGDPHKREYMLHLGSAIVQDRGIVTFFHLVRDSVKDAAPMRKRLFEVYDSEIANLFPNVFYRVDIVDDVYRGTVQVAQSYGVGHFETNTVMIGWPHKPERGPAYVTMLRDLVTLDRSLFLVRYDRDHGFGRSASIHIWWGGLQGNGGLMLLLAFLLTAHHRWRRAKVTVLTVVSGEGEKAAAEHNLRKLLASARLDADPRVILRGGRTIPEIMHVESGDADLAIVGIRLPLEGEPVAPFFDRMNTILGELRTTILVLGARNFEGEPVLFDGGSPTMMPPPPPTQPPEEPSLRPPPVGVEPVTPAPELRGSTPPDEPLVVSEPPPEPDDAG